MPCAPPPTPVSTFVVRLWRPRATTEPCWQGRIVHLQSGRSLAFRRLDAIAPFIRATCGMGKDRVPKGGQREGQ